MAPWSIGIDVGGTYVDVVAVADAGRACRHKIPRRNADPALSVLAAIDEALKASDIAPAMVGSISHGSTLVTNLLLEQTAPPVAVITNRGFGDVLAIGRQNRNELYTLAPAVQTPTALFPPELRFGINGRLDAAGAEAEPLDPAELADVAARIAASGVQAVAICLLHATRNPVHEIAVATMLAQAAPALAVSLSHQVDVAPGEFERFLATALDAYVKPLTRRYLAALGAGLRQRGLPEPAIVISDASLRLPVDAAAAPLRLALAGPAAAMGGFRLHGTAGDDGETCISVETGGTTTDIGLIGPDGIVCGRRVAIGGMAVSLRATDILSVPVGGGSVVQVNAAGALRLGPQSMGSLPGPAAYGRGGKVPTLTDALMVLGRLPMRLAGGLDLDMAAAREVMAGVAGMLGCDVVAAAQAVVATAATMIAEGVKAHAYRHGVDPTAARLIAGGGGGAQHAAEVAGLLGSDRVTILPDAAVVSALGCLAAPLMDAEEHALDLVIGEAGWPLLQAALRATAARAGAAPVEWTVEVVYQGQSAALEIPFDPQSDDAAALARRFDAAHERVRGHAFDRPRQLQRLRGQWATRRAALQSPLSAGASLPAAAASRPGPDAVFTETTSIWIPAGWACRQTQDGLELRRAAEPGAAIHRLEGAA